MEFIDAKTALFIFSDVESSPQLETIAKLIDSRVLSFRVIQVGNENSILMNNLRESGIFVHHLKKPKKFLSIRLMILIGKDIFFFKPDLLYASGQYASFYGLLNAKILRVERRIYTRHHSNFHYIYRMYHGIILDKIVNYSATQIISVSETVSKILSSKENVPQNKIIQIYNGIELSKFLILRKFRVRFNLEHHSHDFPKILVISRHTDLKGVFYIGEAFLELLKVYPMAHITFIGEKSDAYPRLRDLLSKIDPERYEFIFHSQNVDTHFKFSDLFIHVPVGPEVEAFGLVYIEAIAAGIPIVCTKSGVLSEFPNLDQYLSYVDYRDSLSIYKAITSIIDNELNVRIPVPSEWLQEFSIENMARKYLQVLL